NEARRKKGTLCPTCFALIHLREISDSPPLELSGGRLEGEGYRVSVSSGGLVPFVEMATPSGVVFRGKEPGKGLTHIGRAVLLVGSPLVLAVGLMLASPLTGGHLLAPAALALGVALLSAGYVCLNWRPEGRLSDRAVEHAWTTLVPHILDAKTGT